MDLSGLKNNYDKYYKKLLVIPILFLILSVGVLCYHKATTGEFISKDMSLKGGVSITVETDKVIDIPTIESKISSELNTQTGIRELNSVTSAQRIGYVFEMGKETNVDAAKKAISEIAGLEIIEGKYTIEEMSSALGESFWSTTIKAMLLAFLFMSLVVFYFFRALPVSIAIILCAATDIICTIGFIDILGIKLSTAGVAAILMLIGYSVDTDILLSTRVLKREGGTVNEKIFSSMKTGLTMQITTLIALITLWIFSQAAALKQISSILIIGVLFDMINTWIQNASILKWYAEKKVIHFE